MKKGEIGIIAFMGVAVVVVASFKAYNTSTAESEEQGIPYYSTASQDLARQARVLLNKHQCYDCHSLWTKRNIMQSVPAPALDGLGSLKDEEWFYSYFSASDPQSILPTRLKAEFKMPSFAELSDQDRRTLAKYMSSLKVKDWYLEETRKREFEKLTGNKPES